MIRSPRTPALPNSCLLYAKFYVFSCRAQKVLPCFLAILNPIPPGLFEGGSAWGGGGGRKVPAAYNSKTINDNKMKFGGVVKDH